MEAVRESIAAGPAVDVSQAEQTSLGVDPASQDEAVRAILAKRFPNVPVTVDRTGFVSSVGLQREGSDEPSSLMLLADDSALRARVTLTSGEWPSGAVTGGPVPVAVDAAVATRLKAGVGSTFTFAADTGVVPVVVAAIWMPKDAAATAWLGLNAGTGGTDGRVILPERDILLLDPSPAVQWVVGLDPAKTRPEQLSRLATGFDGLTDALTVDATASPSPVSQLGRVVETISAMQRSIGALRAVVPVPIALLVVCSIIAMVLLALLLNRSRMTETRLLRARGATVGGIVTAGTVEVAAVGLVGVVVGFALAQLWLAIGWPLRPLATPAGLAELLIPPALVLVTVCVVGALVTADAARSAAGLPGELEAGRSRSALSVGLAVLAVAAAAVTLWRFLAFGSPIGASGAVDPVGVVAPAAVLCAIAMLGLLSFGPVAAFVERFAGRNRGISAVLPARQVGRGLAVFSAPVALVVLATGAAMFSAGYVGTWSAFLSDSSRLVNGAAVRASLSVAGTVRGPEDAIGVHRFTALQGAGVGSPALQTDYGIGQASLSFVGVDAARLGLLVDVGEYMFDARAVAHELRPSAASALRGIALPSSADAIQLTAELTSPIDQAAPTLTLGVWVADPGGELVPLTAAQSAADDGERRFVAALPDGGPWTLVAIDAHLDTGATATPAGVSVTGIAALHGTTTSPIAVPGEQNWAPVPDAFGRSFTVERGSTGLFGYTSPLVPPSGDNAVRFMPTGTTRLPIVLTQTAAAESDFSVGDTVSLDGAWSNLRGVVVAVVPAVPGVVDERAGLADLLAIDNQVLRTSPDAPRLNAVWLDSDDADRLAPQVSRLAGPDAVVTTDSGTFVSRFMSSAVVSLWLGAIGCCLLALVAIGASLSALLRRRRGEVGVLWAVGVSSRQLVSARRVEIVGVVLAAAVFGLVGGVVAFLVAGNTLARLSVVTAPSTLSVQGRIDLIALIAALVVVGLAIAGIVWHYGRAIRRQVGDTGYREETR